MQSRLVQSASDIGLANLANEVEGQHSNPSQDSNTNSHDSNPQDQTLTNNNNNNNNNNSSSRSAPQRSPLAPAPDTSPGFTVIWQNLTYKVDTRRWYTKVRQRFFNSTSDPATGPTNNAQSNQNYSTPSYGERTIIDQICGHAQSGQISAIMGPSGAGKSSLLHCLFQNRTLGTSGRILVDSATNNKLKVCFIPQRDYLNEWLTVREDLVFVSKLKSAKLSKLINVSNRSSSRTSAGIELSEATENSYVKQTANQCSTSLIDHEANAVRVAELLGLINCLDVIIKNISGGQKKRLSIARELMSSPDILILDEPTTGLDSLTCQRTIMVLKDVVRRSANPMAIVCTIHQPQKMVFNLFDKVYMLSSSGKVIFDGCPKESASIIETIAQLKMPSPNYNPATQLIEIASDPNLAGVADHLSAYQRKQFYEQYDSAYLDNLTRKPTRLVRRPFGSFDRCASGSTTRRSITSIRVPSSPSSCDSHVMDLPETTAGNDLTQAKCVKASTSIESAVNANTYFISRQLSNCLSSHRNSFARSCRHVLTLTHRSWLCIVRNPSFVKSRFIFHTILPLFMLAIFGTAIGRSTNCPKYENTLDTTTMHKSIEGGTISDNVESIRLTLENLSFFFVLMYGFAINVISCTASIYPFTMHMFKKETINGLYSSAPYFIGQTLAELPFELLYPSISIVLSYQMTGQVSSYLEWRMFAVSFMVFLTSYSIHSIGLLCGAIFINNVSMAVIVGQLCLLPFCMLSGFLIRPARMSQWMRSLAYISPFKHGLSGIMAARYGFNLCDCDENLISADDEGVTLSGMTPQVRHVMDYMFPANASEGEDVSITEIFDQLSGSFVKAQTFGLDMKSCEDVRPYVLHLAEIVDTDLYKSIGCIIIIIALLKFITFSIMRSLAYRIN